jgi:hypothetical protein
MILAFPRPDAAWMEVGPISVVIARRRWRLNLSKPDIQFEKPDTLIFHETSDCAPARSSSNRAGEPRHGSLVNLSEVLLCSRLDQKVRQHILMTLLGNRSSPTMAHYGMEIYNNNTIMTSIYVNPEVRYINYLFIPQTYNTNMVDRSNVGMRASSSHVNMHNSYSSTDISR